MYSMGELRTSCARCGAAIDALRDLPGNPCERCGSTVRAINGVGAVTAPRVEVDFHMQAVSREIVVSKSRGRENPARLQTLKQERSRRDNVRRAVSRILRRDLPTPMYEEVIVDEGTGELYRHMLEPLAFHRGHGSAKKRSLPDAVSWAMNGIAESDGGTGSTSA